MSAAQQDAGADDLLAQLQPRDMAALRCRGKCFIEMEATTSVDVAVTAFHMIFLISHQGTRTSRLAWSDVANMHLSVNQGRHCAIIEFFVHKPKSAAHKPAVSSPKLTKVAQMIQADTTAKEADASSRVLKQIFAQKSVVEKMADETLAAKPLTFYIEDTRVDDNERSIVIASQRAFMYFLFHKQTQISLSTKSLVYDEPDLLKQYSALENDVAAALSNEELLPLLEDLEDGARHHTIKYTFMHRPLILNRLTKELSSFRMRPALSRQDGPTLPSLLSSKLNIRVATAAFRCISAIACDAYSLFNKEDAVATSAAEQCLLAAVAPVTSDVEMSDDRMRVALSALLQAQVESVFNCLFLCFRTPSPSLIPFLSAHLTPEQVSAFVSSAVYSLLRSASFLFDAKHSSDFETSGPSAAVSDLPSTPEPPQAAAAAVSTVASNIGTSARANLPLSPSNGASLSVDVTAVGSFPPGSPNRSNTDDAIRRCSVSVVQHVMLLHSLLPPASSSPTMQSPVSLLQPHEVELRYILRQESMARLSRVMSLQLQQLLLESSSSLLSVFPKQSSMDF